MNCELSAFAMPGTDPLALELQRLAWMEKHFDDACKAATKFDGSYERAMQQFWQSSREAGVANNAPAINSEEGHNERA